MGDIDEAARQVHHSDGLDHAVKAGLVVYGVVHLLVGGLALQLAFGERAASASSTGALHALAGQPFGAFLVWVVAAGMLLLVLWRLLEAWLGREDEDGGTKIAKQGVSLGKAVLYGTLGFSAAKVAYGDSTDSGGSGGGGGGKSGGGGSGGGGGGTDGMTAQVMMLPGGTWIVGLVGLGVIGYGVSYIYRGLTEKYLKHLDGDGRTGNDGHAYRLLGKVGHVAKGVAVGAIGGLFVFAALTHDAQKSGGLDQALQKVAAQPFGQAVLTAVALGIGCYGLFCFARAKHLDR